MYRNTLGANRVYNTYRVRNVATLTVLLFFLSCRLERFNNYAICERDS